MNPTVDYFTLDIEGDELTVLKTIPFDKVDIKVLSVEIIHGGEKGDGPNDLDEFMKSQGYIYYGSYKVLIGSVGHIFVKKQFDLALEIHSIFILRVGLHFYICSPNSLISSIHPKSFFDLFGNKSPQVGI